MEYMDALRARWACKLYDESLPVTEAEETEILESARLAPSSFGLEHWRFVSVRGEAARLKLYGACLAQDGVRTAPLIVVALARAARFYEPDGDFCRARSARFPGGHAAFRDDYRAYFEALRARGSLEHWAKAQTYLACANMMNAAASLGVDSCAIEGFEEAAVLATLAESIPGFSAPDWLVGLVCTFGHAGEPRRERIRASLDELATRI